MSMKHWVIAAGAGLVLGALAGRPVGAEVRQTLDVGAQTKDIDTPAAKFEEYRDVPKNIMINRYTQEATYETGRFDLDVRDLLREDRRITLKGDYRRKVSVSVLWDQTPHRFASGDISRTIYSQPRPGVFTLDTGLKTTNQGLMDNFAKKYSTAAYTNSLNAALLNATPAELKFRNDTGRVGVKLNPTDDVTVRVGAGQTARTGTKSIGASLGFSGAIELPAPVDDVTRDASLGLEYATKKFQAQAGYQWSQYDNNIVSLIWDSPKRLTDQTYSGAYSNADGSARGRMPVPGDSLTQRLNGVIGVSDLPWRGRFTAAVTYARATQSTDLLPYTINSKIKTSSPGLGGSTDASNPDSLPARIFNARIDTLVQRYAVHLRPADPVGIQVAYRDQKQENKSDQIIFPGAVFLDQTWSTGVIENELYGFTKRDVDGDVKLKVVKPLTLGAGAGYNWTERHDREAEKSNETSLRGSADWDPLRWANVGGSVLYAMRRIDHWDLAHGGYKTATGAFAELPGMRRFDVADRDRLQGRAGVSLPLSDALTLGLSGLVGKDEFLPGPGDLTGGVATNLNQPYGFLSDKYRSGTVTADYAPLEKLSLSAFADIGRNESRERSNTSGHTPPPSQDALNDWTADMTDDYLTGGAGITVRPVADLGLRTDYTYTKSKGQIALTDIAATTTLVELSPPETVTFRHTGKVRADYRLSKTFSVGAAYMYENYDVTDWATNNIPRVPGKTSTGTANPNGLWLGASSVSYVAHVVGGNVQARF